MSGVLGRGRNWGPVFVLLCVSAQGCTVQVHRHDQNAAAACAEAFLTAAVIDRDLESAFAMMSEAAREQTTLGAFSDLVSSLHTRGFPEHIEVTSFEKLPGRAAISVHLTGKNDAQQFYYVIPMVGTKKTGYTPGGLFRSDQAPSDARQLES